MPCQWPWGDYARAAKAENQEASYGKIITLLVRIEDEIAEPPDSLA